METETKTIESFIEECERLAYETGEPHFVLDWKTLHEIHKRSAETKEAKREADLEEILDEEEFSIGDIQTVNLMPSMQIHYDTVSKIKDSTDRTNWAIKRMQNLGFEIWSIYRFLEDDDTIPVDTTKEFTMKVELDAQLGVEISYFIPSVLLRIMPNLMSKVSYVSEYETKEIYSGFLIPERIIEAMANNIKEEYMTPIVREMKLADLLG